jgi:hypothetical protein
MIFPKPPLLVGHFPAEASSKIQAEALELQLLPIDDSQNRTRWGGPFCIPAMKPPGMTWGWFMKLDESHKYKYIYVYIYIMSFLFLLFFCLPLKMWLRTKSLGVSRNRTVLCGVWESGSSSTHHPMTITY